MGKTHPLRTSVIIWAALLVLPGLAACADTRAAGSVYTIDAGKSSQPLQADILEDPGGRLELADIQALDADFIPLQGATLPPSDSAWWLRVSLLRPPGATQDWVLIAGIPSLLDIQLFAPTTDGYQVFPSGAGIAQSLRPLPSWEPRFSIRLGDDVQTLYLRVQDPAELLVPLLLVDEIALAQRDRERAVWMSLFLGLMTGLLVYNLFLYLSLLDSAYGWYVVSGSALLLCFLMITGWGGLYLWPEASQFEALSRLLLPAVWGAAYWRFIGRFFALDAGYPRLNRLVQLFSILFVLIALWSLSGERFYGARALHLLAIIALPCVFVIGILRWRDGFRPAGAVLLGQLALVSPVFFMALRVSGVIGASPLIDNGLLLGAAGETLFFAVALAQRIRSAENARDSAQSLLLAERQALLEQVEAHNLELENRVAERTAELQEANRNLEEQQLGLAREASLDNLTGLANRKALAQRFQLVSALCERSTTEYALLLLDLDGFKTVNDTAGHDAGDSVLRALAQRLQALVRAGDILARIGGDEFVVLMSQNASTSEAHSFALRLVDAVRQPITVGSQTYVLDASIGIASSIAGTDTLSDMMRRADQAMYRAKRGDSQPRIMLAS